MGLTTLERDRLPQSVPSVRAGSRLCRWWPGMGGSWSHRYCRGLPVSECGTALRTPATEHDSLSLSHPQAAPLHARGKLPVAIWIHGGAYVDGSSNDWPIDALVARSNNTIIVVSVNCEFSVMLPRIAIACIFSFICTDLSFVVTQTASTCLGLWPARCMTCMHNTT